MSSLALCLVVMAIVVPLAHAQAQDEPNPIKEELELQKLEEQVAQLRRENDPLSLNATNVAALGGLVALASLLVTLGLQRREFKRQREADRQQRETESVRRLDEQFASMSADLGSGETGLRLAGSASIETFMKPENRAHRGHLYDLLRGLVKQRHGDVTDMVLARSFASVLRRYLPTLSSGEERQAALDLEASNIMRSDLRHVDLNGAQLRDSCLDASRIGGIVLEGADLSGASLRRVQGRGESTRLSGATFDSADLQEADLREARLGGASFRDRANLISAKLQSANLKEAAFFDARLQSAHLEGATLIGAQFDGADVRDTYFADAIFDPGALRSLKRAFHWQEAHYDPRTEQELERLQQPAERQG